MTTGDTLPTAIQREQLIHEIDMALPQTQCTKCGFEGCRPYAQAIVNGEAQINRCPPGGQAGVRTLARLVSQAEIPLDPDRGTPGPLTLAVIDEIHCIGCTLCIQACPVDAIVGANKHMHTVVSDACTGCELCIAPCPVDCITMLPLQPQRYWNDSDATLARQRYHARNQRLVRLEAAKTARPPSAGALVPDLPAALPVQDAKKAAIAAALARARARRTP